MCFYWPISDWLRLLLLESIMSRKSFSMLDFIQKYHQEEACETALIQARWPSGPTCPKCGCSRVYRLRIRRSFQCAGCSHQVSLTVGTIMEHSKLPLTKWFLAMYLVSANKQSISATSLGKHWAISRVSATYLLHKIRSAMQRAHFKTWLSGLVCVDEGYVGGAISSPHESARSTIKKSPIIAMVEEQGRNQTGAIHMNRRCFWREKPVMGQFWIMFNKDRLFEPMAGTAIGKSIQKAINIAERKVDEGKQQSANLHWSTEPSVISKTGSMDVFVTHANVI